MADLIDREAVLEFPIRLTNYDKEHGDENFVLGIESVLEYAEYLPAIDAVEAGTCEGCIYSNRKRPQKCSCCRRNKDLKDCYEAEENGSR